jgi:CheY-like chemotaxis protein
VLIIEDSQDDARFLRRLLDRAGVLNPIRVVINGKETMAYLEGKPPYSNRGQWPLPSVIILDLKLPDMDGFDLLEWCKAHHQCRETLIVILSGHGDTTTIRKGYDLGAQSFLRKPCRAIDLDNLIRGYPQYWERGGK